VTFAAVGPPPSATKEVLKYGGLLAFVLTAGAGAWLVHEHVVAKPSMPTPREDIIEFKSQILGWISAALYRKPATPFLPKLH
jgi:hypothetical protein